MTRTCRACPQPHPIYMQAEPDWYRASLSEQLSDAAGCAFSMAWILALAVFLWLTIFGLFALAVK